MLEMLLAAGLLLQPVTKSPKEALPSRAPAVQASPPGGERAPFRPEVNGFGFVNSFRGTPVPAAIRSNPLMKGIAEAAMGDAMPATFGLCGGMSLAAADFYIVNRGVPADVTPPERGALREYLELRQLQSLGPAAIMATKFLEWMAAPDAGATGTRVRTANELEAIQASLKRWGVAPVGLVYVRTPGNSSAKGQVGSLWENHQVLAYSVSQPSGGELVFQVYDPNYPKRVVSLRLKPTDEERGPRGYTCTLEPVGRSARSVRGVFAMPYAPQTPPPMDAEPAKGEKSP